MGLQRTFIGVLVAFSLRRYGAVALPYGSFQDLVAFLQHPVTLTTAEGDASSPSAGLSLLALDAGASAKWYETSADDEALVRKLTGRMRANEESEQQRAEAALAANASGASFLRVGGASMAKDQHRWLTEKELKQSLEDEEELARLAAELQRIAKEVQQIAKHQLEFGLHLGLPDPNVEHYAVGDKVELRISKEGKNKGRWIKAVIQGFGPRTDTYAVHISVAAKEGKQDLPDVPVAYLRRDEEVTKGLDLTPTIMKYEVGEQAQIQMALGIDTTSWVKCMIRSKGSKPDTYNVHVSNVMEGHQDQRDVPASSLRKADSGKLFNQYDVDGDGLLNDQEWNVAVKEKANRVKASTLKLEHVAGLEEAALFAVGEPAELLPDVSNQSAMNCTIMGEGNLADTYNIYVPSAVVGYQYVTDVNVARLAKVGQNKVAFLKKVQLIPPFVDHEVLSPRGAYKGRWVPCQLKRKARGETYTVWMPFGVSKGHNTAANIEPSQIRLRKTCGPGYEDIFNADVPGPDSFGRVSNKKDSVEACAADCNNRLTCGSFEYSLTTKDCSLNKVQDPTLPAGNDQMFCRRKELPKTAVWRGPLLGQPLEYLMTLGPHNGEWHPGSVASFGSKPDTYNVNASIAYLGGENTSTILPEVPIQYLRYSKDEAVPSLADNWVPPEGKAATWVNRTDASATEDKRAQALQNFLVAPPRKRDEGDEAGLLFHASKRMNDTIGSNALAPWGSYVLGIDEGDGWVRVGDSTFLPTFVDGLQMLTPRIKGEIDELVQVMTAGIWAPAYIRSPGDKPGTYNVRYLKANSKHLNNVPIHRLRKDVSAPLAVETPRPAATTTPPKAPSAAKPKAAKPAAVEPAKLVTNTTTAAPAVQALAPTTTPITEAQVEVVMDQYFDYLRREAFANRSQVKEELANFTETKATQFLVDNRLLHHKGPGLSFRRSKRLEDSDRNDVALWGKYVTGEDEGDGWLRVGKKYLPTFVKGMPVVTKKVMGDSGEIVQVEQEDGSWAHGTIRSKGDWPQTFNVHVVYNGEGYDLDNMPARRLQHSLAAPWEKAPLEEVAKLEVAAPSEAERLLEGGDLGEDLPDGTFRVNMTAEVKINAGPQAGHWVRCRIVEQGDLADTYNLFVPSAPKGYADMKNIPVLAMRKCRRSSQAAPAGDVVPPAAANVSLYLVNASEGIDGEVGESVEVFIRKGTRAGRWKGAVILRPGNVTDCYDVRMPGLRGTHRDIINVPGMQMRKAGYKIEIFQEPDYTVYKRGDRAFLDADMGNGTVKIFNCTVQQKGEFSNTYDVTIEGEGEKIFPGVHAKFMRKIFVPDAPTTSVTTTTTKGPPVLDWKAFMYISEELRPDLGPVFSKMLKSKNEMKRWLVRASEWPEGCEAKDRSTLLAKLHEMGQATAAQINASVPKECMRSTWSQTGGGGVLWDDLSKCFAVATHISDTCAFCGAKMLLNVAATCLSKCHPMISACKGEQAEKSCPAKASHCADCVQDPIERFMKCAGIPDRADLSAAMDDFSKAAKAGNLDVAAALSKHRPPGYFDEVDHLVKLGVSVVMQAWKVVFSN